MNIFNIFLEYEKSHFGTSGTTLSGKPFLQSELQWFNRYLVESIEKRDKGEEQSHLFIKDLQAEIWSEYPLYLYDYKNLDEKDVNRVIKKTILFIAWLGEIESLDSAKKEMALNAIQVSKKEVSRLYRIHQHLNSVIHSRVYFPGPTVELDDIEWEYQLHDSQFPHILEKKHDIYSVVSKDKNKKLLYLKGLSSGDAIVLKGDQLLSSLVQSGDRFKLTLGLTDEDNYFLLEYGYPLIDHSR